MQLNTNQEIIIRELCEVQFESLSNISGDFINNPTEDLKEVGISQELLVETWETTVATFKNLYDTPQLIDQMGELDLLVVLYILSKLGDRWKYKTPVAHKSLCDRVSFLIMQKKVLEGLQTYSQN
jgi:hypothetical protein